MQLSASIFALAVDLYLSVFSVIGYGAIGAGSVGSIICRLRRALSSRYVVFFTYTKPVTLLKC